VVQQAGVTSATPPGETQIRLEAFAPEIVRGIYTDIVAECRKRGVLPVWVYIPMPGVNDASVNPAELVELATQAGFVVINLAHWVEGYSAEELKVDRYHASPLGHRVIAQLLEMALRERPDALPPCARP
jgi:hypothetical protein